MKLWNNRDKNARVELPDDKERLISRGLEEEPGEIGAGLISKMSWRRNTRITITLDAAKQGYLTKVLAENPGLRGRFEVSEPGKQITVVVPENSPSARVMGAATVWFPRPFVARWMLNASAIGTGRWRGSWRMRPSARSAWSVGLCRDPTFRSAIGRGATITSGSTWP